MNKTCRATIRDSFRRRSGRARIRKNYTVVKKKLAARGIERHGRDVSVSIGTRTWQQAFSAAYFVCRRQLCHDSFWRGNGNGTGFRNEIGDDASGVNRCDRRGIVRCRARKTRRSVVVAAAALGSFLPSDAIVKVNLVLFFCTPAESLVPLAPLYLSSTVTVLSSVIL